jgi:hypothetical protein
MDVKWILNFFYKTFITAVRTVIERQSWSLSQINRFYGTSVYNSNWKWLGVFYFLNSFLDICINDQFSDNFDPI